jgi:hypothetical protein
MDSLSTDFSYYLFVLHAPRPANYGDERFLPRGQRVRIYVLVFTFSFYQNFEESKLKTGFMMFESLIYHIRKVVDKIRMWY